MFDKAIQGTANFMLGVSLNISFNNFIETADPIISFIANCAGLVFTLIGVFYIYQALRYKKAQRKKIENERDK